jgi:threonine synthase
MHHFACEHAIWLSSFSSASTVQIVLSTAHPAKFSEAVSCALAGSPAFDFERDVLPAEFKGLLEREKRVIYVKEPSVDLVKQVINTHVQQ